MTDIEALSDLHNQVLEYNGFKIDLVMGGSRRIKMPERMAFAINFTLRVPLFSLDMRTKKYYKEIPTCQDVKDDIIKILNRWDKNPKKVYQMAEIKRNSLESIRNIELLMCVSYPK